MEFQEVPRKTDALDQMRLEIAALREITENEQGESDAVSPMEQEMLSKSSGQQHSEALSQTELSDSRAGEVEESSSTMRMGMVSNRSHVNTQKAIPLVTLNDITGNFSVNENAAKILEKRTSNKIAVVSIFGTARSGKSFLLN